MTDTIERSDTERMRNIGLPVDTKKFGPGHEDGGLKIRELYLEEILELSAEIIQILRGSFSKIKDVPKEDTLNAIVQDPALIGAVRKILAKATERQPDDFKQMVASDWLKVINGAKVAIDWRELKELFTQAIPPEALQKLRGYLDAKKAEAQASGLIPQSQP